MTLISLAGATDQFKVLLSSTDSNFTDCSVQLSIPDDEDFDFQDALTMEAIKLITKCRENTPETENTLQNVPDCTSNNILSMPSASTSRAEEINVPFEHFPQTQDDSNCGTCGSKVKTPNINAAKATITSKEDGKSVINIPLVVKREDLTRGASVELPIKVGDDQNPKFVVQINLPRCLDCKNEPSCECCKSVQCDNDKMNVSSENLKNKTVMNPTYGNGTCAVPATCSIPTTCDISEIPLILDPSLEKEINSLL